MRPVSDGSGAAIVPQNARSGGGADSQEFSTHLRQTRQSARAADTSAASSGASATKPGKAEDASSQDAPADPPQDANVQWLAAQMLAFKMKEPVQTVGADGSVQTTIKTSVVTLPRSALERGSATADGVPTLDPKTGLLVMKPASGDPAAGPPAAGDPATLPVDTPSDAAANTPVDPASGQEPNAPLPGVDVPPSDVPADPAAQDPTLTGAGSPLDPTTVDPNAPDPNAVDPALAAELPSGALSPDSPDALPGASDPTSDPASPGSGQASSSGVAADVSLGRAGAVSSGMAGGHHGGGFSGDSQDDSGGSDAQLSKLASTSSAGGVTAPSVQVQLAVPADRQLAPSLGAELASTAQGMSALERVLQASDQAQANTPVMKVLNVQLAPPDLGNVSMRLALDGNSLEVHMSVDQGRTRALIERDRHVIEDSLTKVGYSINTLTVEHTSASSQSNMSSAGQSFTSNNGYDGSSGRQSNGAGSFGGSQGHRGQGQGFAEADVAVPVPARVAAGRGVFV